MADKIFFGSLTVGGGSASAYGFFLVESAGRSAERRRHWDRKIFSGQKSIKNGAELRRL